MKKNLFRIELGKTLCREDARLLLLLGLVPVLLAALLRLGGGAWDISAVPMGAVEFVMFMLYFQDLICVPMLVGVFIASMSYYQELHDKQVYLYRDLDRRKILNAKYGSIYAVYVLFLLLFTLMSFVSYYLIFRNGTLATGTFLSEPNKVAEHLYEIAQIFLGVLFYIHVGIVFALHTSTGTSIFGMLLFYLFARLSPHYKAFRYVFPIGYREVVSFSSHPYAKSMLLSLLVWFIYSVALYIINWSCFSRKEFL